MDEALQALAVVTSAYTDSTPMAKTVRAVHVNEIHGRVQ